MNSTQIKKMSETEINYLKEQINLFLKDIIKLKKEYTGQEYINRVNLLRDKYEYMDNKSPALVNIIIKDFSKINNSNANINKTVSDLKNNLNIILHHLTNFNKTDKSHYTASKEIEQVFRDKYFPENLNKELKEQELLKEQEQLKEQQQ